MSISIQKVSPAVGAVVKGVDLSTPVPLDTFEVLEGALAEHGVLVFRDSASDAGRSMLRSAISSVPLRGMSSLRRC